jgi:hypothetical protein
MIKFFRKIRQKTLTENKFGKYLVYAIGEIILVVIGILVALQINNANEIAKQNKQVKNYEKRLITELRSDLGSLYELDTIYRTQVKHINNFISYYQSSDRDVNVIVRKMDSIRYNRASFTSIAFTIDDIISTGNLSLFSEQKKEAILYLKNAQEWFENNLNVKDEKWVLSNLEFEHKIDVVAFYKLKFDDKNIKDWRNNLLSEQYRLYSNKIAAETELYEYRSLMCKVLIFRTENLLKLLGKD